MKKSMLLLTLFLSMSVMLMSCKESKKETKTEQTEHAVEKADLALNDAYQCPMDCENGKTYDKKGTCPICKMELKKVEKEGEESESNQDEHEHNEETEELKEG